MAVAAKSLVLGLFTGILLGIFLHQVVPSTTSQQVPSTRDPDGLSSFDAVFDKMLRLPLQMRSRVSPILTGLAKQYAWAGQYKKSHTAASSLSSVPTSAASYPSSTRAFSSSSPTMSATKPFLQAVKERRTIYALNKEAPISDDKIVELAKDAVLHVPSSFNSQSARLVVLLNAEHDKFWNFVKEVLKPMVPEDQWSHTEQRVNGFLGGYGTILFFEDPEPVHALEKAFPIYAHHFPTWSEHTSAMHQYALWVALEAEGFGANLQHYNPIIDRKAQEEWNIPLDWALRAQLVFGGRAGEPAKKEFKPVEGERLFVHGAKK